MSRVLIVDDEPQLLRALRINLRARGMEVVTAATGAEALARAADSHPNLVILDLGLPDIDGMEVLEGIRGWSSVPIIVLSARMEPQDKVDALDRGADDYVTKPFGMDEFFARVRAALRRASSSETAVSEVVTASFTVDLAAKQVRRGNEVIRVTPTEWGILEILAKNAGNLVSQQDILRAVWGPGYERETHYLRTYLGYLRRKLEPDPTAPRHLITEAGMGYRLVP